MSEWYKSWFNRKEYLELYKHRDRRDASKIVELIISETNLRKGAEVLDMACGNGRHSILFARRGFSTIGIDLSRFLISEARKMLQKHRGKFNLAFKIQDMREMKWENRFDLAVNLFTSFGYFPARKDDIRVIRNIYRALKKGGYFVLDFINSIHIRNNLKTLDVKNINNSIVIQVREIINNYVRKTILIAKNNPNGNTPFLEKFYEQIRLYSYDELKAMLEGNGLSILKIFGDYNGNKFSISKSERLIIIAVKV